MTGTSPEPKKSSPLFGGTRSEALVGILMALVVIQIALITYLFTLAEDANGDAGRDAQIFAMQALGRRTVGNFRAAYDRSGAYNRWVELNTLARDAEQKGNSASADSMRAARDRIARLSPALQPPYFNPAKDAEPNLAAYEAETFVREAAMLSEDFENQYRLKVQYSDKASAYSIQLTMLAVALFVLGVAANSRRRVRGLFVGVGIGISVIVMAWMLLTYFTPVRALSEEAIAAYARGSALLYQNDLPKAIAAYDEAIQRAPSYTNAYRDRAIARYYANDVAGAAADFEQTRANGDGSSEIASALGFMYYALGKFEQAKPLHASAVENKPTEVWIRMNAAINLLASGETAAARRAYDELLHLAATNVSAARARGQEPPLTLWFEFDEGANDLDALVACAARQVCGGTPAYAQLKNAPEIANAGREISTHFKEYSVALEYTSKPPPETVNATVEPFVLTRELSKEDEPIAASDTFTATDEPVYVGITFRNLRDGEKIVIKVYVDGKEDERLRVVADYSSAEMGGADGDILLPITTGGIPLSEGAYRIEMYVDGKLVQQGDFRVIARQ